MTIDQRHELEDKYRHLGYVEGRKYLMDALTEEHRLSLSSEIRDFITKFIRIHSDTNVEIK